MTLIPKHRVTAVAYDRPNILIVCSTRRQMLDTATRLQGRSFDTAGATIVPRCAKGHARTIAGGRGWIIRVQAYADHDIYRSMAFIETIVGFRRDGGPTLNVAADPDTQTFPTRDAAKRAAARWVVTHGETATVEHHGPSYNIVRFRDGSVLTRALWRPIAPPTDAFLRAAERRGA